MDLQLGDGIDGVETTRRLTAAPGEGPHVLVLTTYDTDADITRAIEAGATGYLLKAERRRNCPPRSRPPPTAVRRSRPRSPAT